MNIILMLKLVTIILFVFKNSKNRDGMDQRQIINEEIKMDVIYKHFNNKNKLAILESNSTSIFEKIKIAKQVISPDEIKPFNILGGGLLNEWNNNF
jgi:hypothetical protein